MKLFVRFGLALLLGFISCSSAVAKDGVLCEKGNCECGNDKCAAGATCINNKCVCGESYASASDRGMGDCSYFRDHYSLALYDTGMGEFTCDGHYLDSGTSGSVYAYRYLCTNKKGCKLPDGSVFPKGYSYPWEETGDNYGSDSYMVTDYESTFYGQIMGCMRHIVSKKFDDSGCSDVELSNKEIKLCVDKYYRYLNKDVKSKRPSGNSLQPIRMIIYGERTSPTWLVFRDPAGNSCAVITNSKYELLQKNRWCIPFKTDDDLKDSLVTAATTEKFSEYKICKKGSKTQPASGDRDSYCKAFNEELQNEATQKKWYSLAEACADKSADPKLKEYCLYLY